MRMSTDEDVLRAALAAATQSQPDAPVDRYDAVRRRSAHRRQQQFVAMGVAAVLAVVGAAVSVIGVRSGGGQGDQFAKRPVPSWALQWPDRRDPSIPKTVLTGALTAWARQKGLHADTVLDPRQGVIWYLAAKVASRHEIVVMFEVDGGGAHELVMGSADASQVMNGQPGFDEGSGGSPWVLYTVPAPKPGPGVVLGLNVHDSEAATSPDHFADNVAVVLADPSADNLAWQVGDSTYGLAAVPMDHGFAEVDTGQVRARVLLTEVRAGSRVLAHNQFVGVPGAADSFAPQLAAVPAFTDVPTSGEDFGEVSGQGPSGFVDDSVVKRGPTTIYARCYGGAVITVSIDADTRAQTVRIPCDDVEHVIHGPALATSNLVDGKGHEWQVKASKLVAWRVAVRVTP